MTEELFWKSTPRKLRIYQKAHKLKTENEMIMQDNLAWIVFGNYYISALSYTLDHALSKNSNIKYIDEPVVEKSIEDSKLTEEERKQRAIDEFVEAMKMMERNWKNTHKKESSD